MTIGQLLTDQIIQIGEFLITRQNFVVFLNIPLDTRQWHQDISFEIDYLLLRHDEAQAIISTAFSKERDRAVERINSILKCSSWGSSICAPVSALALSTAASNTAGILL
ncbi:hypothetical protein [Shewanella benthica]|uniref:hypothetical protein n=1 Tax=Shewanella benthica TaxID=43661 RepID=UPI0012FE0E00|nr:hypothetical protein [Shewanella benthica]